MKIFFNKELIANKISQLRKEKKLTKMQFAIELNVSISCVDKWERCDLVPSLKSVLKICNLFDIKIDDLIFYAIYCK